MNFHLLIKRIIDIIVSALAIVLCLPFWIIIDIQIIFITALKVFKKENIYEVKVDDSIDDVQAAKSAEEEIIRIAHLPD